MRRNGIHIRFIAFRSLTPLFVSVLDSTIRGEPRPSARTTFCLVMIAIGAASYAKEDANFSVVGYSWAAAYLAIIVTEMVYAKHITATVDLSTWGLVLYQNTIALLLFPFASILTGEMTDIARILGFLTAGSTEGILPGDVTAQLPQSRPKISTLAIIPLLVSCVIGTGISFAGWGTRSAISATQFTVLGVACKLATVLINSTVWKHHASIYAQISIATCIIFSVAYQQSSKREKIERSRKPLLPETQKAQSGAK